MVGIYSILLRSLLPRRGTKGIDTHKCVHVHGGPGQYLPEGIPGFNPVAVKIQFGKILGRATAFDDMEAGSDIPPDFTQIFVASHVKVFKP